jgi:hypothetical protein
MTIPEPSASLLLGVKDYMTKQTAFKPVNFKQYLDNNYSLLIFNEFVWRLYKIDRRSASADLR